MVVIPCIKKTVCLFKKLIKGAGEMAHLVRAPLCKQEYLDLDPRTQIKAAQDCVCTCTHWTQGIGREGIWDCWPKAQLHKSHTHYLKRIKLKKTLNIVRWPLPNRTNLHLFHTHTHTHTKNRNRKEYAIIIQLFNISMKPLKSIFLK